MTRYDLTTASTSFRSQPLAGHAPASVDPTGGKKQAGLITGLAAITRGPALGHNAWIDSQFVEDAAAALRQATTGTKSRFTHPDMSSDGLGKQLGRVHGGEAVDDVARTDLHYNKSAHTAPDGDLAGHTMALAEESPEDFGASIVFDHDWAAEVSFHVEHGATLEDDAGYEYLDLTDFDSPDPLNTENLPHPRLAKLLAVDLVDSPAANPNGLFHNGRADIATAAAALASYALGQTDTPPAECSALNINPTRLRDFASRYLAKNNLRIVGAEDMTKKPTKTLAKPANAPTAASSTPAAATADPAADQATNDPASMTAEPAPDPTTPAPTTPAPTSPADGLPEGFSAARKELARYTEAFGATAGPAYFAEGVSFNDGMARQVIALREENTRLSQLCEQLGGDADGVSTQHTDPATNSKPTGLAGLIRISGQTTEPATEAS
jgi:hypothetical protein